MTRYHPQGPSDLKKIQSEMLPEVLQASLRIVFSQFLLSALSGSCSELAANILC